MGKLVDSQGYLGDFDVDSTHHFWFTTCDKDGGSVNITHLGTIRAQRGSNTISSPAGISISQNPLSLADGGLHRVDMDLSADTFFIADNDYVLYLFGCEVDTETINVILCQFSIENRLN